ncbi:MAG TPA: rhodanese-like domain-containing protein [Candidatus Peribacteraceae bacterium]|nr:rhodanese-like domain-containing protein [Candidatus Peribacteraceae bacterium]
MNNWKFLGLALIVGAVGGTLATVGLQWNSHNAEALIAEFYAIENAVYVSPHGLRGKMDKGVQDYILVDLRSAEEYEKEHIAGAINIAAYSDPNTSAYDDIERIVGGFRALPKGKEVIVYCYSMPCMTGRKIGKMLAEHDIYVKHLGIGWNEWRHFWTLWNHEGEWNRTKAEDYIATGKEPGKPNVTPSISPCVEGQFGC